MNHESALLRLVTHAEFKREAVSDVNTPSAISPVDTREEGAYLRPNLLRRSHFQGTISIRHVAHRLRVATKVEYHHVPAHAGQRSRRRELQLSRARFDGVNSSGMGTLGCHARHFYPGGGGRGNGDCAVTSDYFTAGDGNTHSLNHRCSTLLAKFRCNGQASIKGLRF